MLRTEPTAEDSLAAILARSRFGMAIAAMIRMIATTISNSINEKPFCLRIRFFLFWFLKPEFESVSNLGLSDPLASMFARHFPLTIITKVLACQIRKPTFSAIYELLQIFRSCSVSRICHILS